MSAASSSQQQHRALQNVHARLDSLPMSRETYRRVTIKECANAAISSFATPLPASVAPPIVKSDPNATTDSAAAASSSSSTFVNATLSSLEYGPTPLTMQRVYSMARIAQIHPLAADGDEQEPNSSGPSRFIASYRVSDSTASHSIDVVIPARVLFASFPITEQTTAAAMCFTPAEATQSATSFAQLLRTSPHIASCLPNVNQVVEFRGRVQYCAAKQTRRLLASHFHCLKGATDGVAVDAMTQLQDFERETQLFWKQQITIKQEVKPVISSHTSNVHTPSRVGAPPFSSAAQPSSGAKRNVVSPARSNLNTPAAGTRSNLPTPMRTPSHHHHAPLPLPLPLPLPQPQTSLIDEFTMSSQEEAAHVEIADQAAKQYAITRGTTTPQTPQQAMPYQQQQQPYQPQQMRQQPQQSHPSMQYHQPASSAVTTPIRNIWSNNNSTPFQPRSASTTAASPALPASAPRTNAQTLPQHAPVPAPAPSALKYSSRPTSPATFVPPRPFIPTNSSASNASAPSSAAPPAFDMNAGFQTGRGTTVAISAAALEAAARKMKEHEKDDPAMMNEFDQTMMNSPKSAAAASTAGVSSIHPDSPSQAPGFDAASFIPSFSTGRGNKVTVSKDAEERARKKFEEYEKEEGKTNAASTAMSQNPDRTSIPAAAAAAASSTSPSTRPFSPSHAPDFNADSFIPSFSTGRGKQLVVSKEAEERARKKQAEYEHEYEKTTPHHAAAASSIAAAAASSSPASVRPLSPSHAANFNPDTFVPSFSTGRGATLKISKEAEERARKKQMEYEREYEKNNPAAAAASSTSNQPIAQKVASPSSSSFDSRPTSPSHDANFNPDTFIPSFSTGRGAKVNVSAAAEQRAKKLMAEVEDAITKENVGAAKGATTPAAAVSSSTAAPSAAAAMGGFSRSKPFRAPTRVQPPIVTPASRLLPATSIAPAAISLPPPQVKPTETRKSKMDMLDAQIEAMEQGEAIDEGMEADAFMGKPSVPVTSAAISPSVAVTGFSSASFKIAPTSNSIALPTAAGGLSGLGGLTIPPHALPKMDAAKLERVRRLQEELAKELMDDGSGSDMAGFSSASNSGFSAASHSIGFSPATATAANINFAPAAFVAPSLPPVVPSPATFSSAASTITGFKRKALSQVPEEEESQEVDTITVATPVTSATMNVSPKASSPSLAVTPTLPPNGSFLNVPSQPAPSSTGSMPSLTSPSPSSAACNSLDTTRNTPIEVDCDTTVSPPTTGNKRVKLTHDSTSSDIQMRTDDAAAGSSKHSPIPIGSFDAIAPRTPHSAATLTRSSHSPHTPNRTPGQAIDLTSPTSSLCIPATPSLENSLENSHGHSQSLSPVHEVAQSLMTQFDEVANEQGKKAQKVKETRDTIEIDDSKEMESSATLKKSAAAFEDDYLPPASFRTTPPHAHHLSQNITTFASEL